MTYADAGVDIDKADALVKIIKKLAAATHRTGVMGEIGGFGGFFSLNVTNMKQPVLVSSTDGVGTKLKIAFMMNKHDTVGVDLVAMCINDIIVQGASPLFFLDYLATGKLDKTTTTDIIKGVAGGCRQAGCALIGGETAEMPGFYQVDEYDLAGFAVGVVDNRNLIDGSHIRVGDILVGLASNGLHSNGFSLVRKICFEKLKLSVDDYIPDFGKTLGEELLTPTRIYASAVAGTLRNLPICGMAHITGGGIADNLLRIIPKACGVRIQTKNQLPPAIFPYLQAAGNIEDEQMRRTFNNGVGMVLVVPESKASEVLDRLESQGQKAFAMGEVTAAEGSTRVKWD